MPRRVSFEELVQLEEELARVRKTVSVLSEELVICKDTIALKNVQLEKGAELVRDSKYAYKELERQTTDLRYEVDVLLSQEQLFTNPFSPADIYRIRKLPPEVSANEANSYLHTENCIEDGVMEFFGSAILDRLVYELLGEPKEAFSLLQLAWLCNLNPVIYGDEAIVFFEKIRCLKLTSLIPQKYNHIDHAKEREFTHEYYVERNRARKSIR